VAEYEKRMDSARQETPQFGPENTSSFETVENLGSLYFEQGRHKEAEMMYKRALAGKEKVWGPEHISTLATVCNLGVLYRLR